MRLQIFRLGSSDQSMGRMGRQACELERTGLLSAENLRPCIGYESAELAAMCCADLLWNVRRHTDLLREAVHLPLDSRLHGVAPTNRFGPFDPMRDNVEPLIEHMLDQELLSLWVPCTLATEQHVVFLNPAHAAFERIVVFRRQLVLTRPAWSGNVCLPEPAVAEPDGFSPELPPVANFFAQALPAAARAGVERSLHKIEV